MRGRPDAVKLEAARQRRKQERETTRIETSDYVMFKADQFNWQIERKDGGGEPYYYSDPVQAAIGLLKVTADRHLCRNKAKTISDIITAQRTAMDEVAKAIRTAFGEGP